MYNSVDLNSENCEYMAMKKTAKSWISTTPPQLHAGLSAKTEYLQLMCAAAN